MLHEEGLCPWKDSITAETREISRGTHKGRWCQGTPNSSVWSIHAEGYFPLQKICWNPSSMTVSSVLTKVSHPHISGILPQSHDFLRLYGGMGESAKTIIVVQIKDTAFCKGLCNQFLILKADLRQKRSPQVLYNIFLLVSAFKSLTEHEVLYLSDHWSSPQARTTVNPTTCSTSAYRVPGQHPIHTCFPQTPTGLMSNNGDEPLCRGISQAKG